MADAVAIFRVQTGNDDGWANFNSSLINRAETAAYFNSSSSSGYDYQTYLRMTHDPSSGAPPPKKRPLRYALLHFVQKNGRNPAFPFRASLEKSPNPDIPAVKADFNPNTGRPRTSIVTVANAAPWVADQPMSINITTQAQEIIDLDTYVPGNPFQAFLDPGTMGDTGAKLHAIHTWNSDPAKAAWLELVYEEGPYTGAGGTTVPDPIAGGTGSTDNPGFTATGADVVPEPTAGGAGQTQGVAAGGQPGSHLLESISAGIASFYPYDNRADNPRLESKRRYLLASEVAAKRIADPASATIAQLQLVDGFADGYVEVDVTRAGADSAQIVRVRERDANNLFFVDVSSTGVVRLYERVAGTGTLRGSGSVGFAQGQRRRIGVSLQAQTTRVFYDDVLLFPAYVDPNLNVKADFGVSILGGADITRHSLTVYPGTVPFYNAAGAAEVPAPVGSGEGSSDAQPFVAEGGMLIPEPVAGGRGYVRPPPKVELTSPMSELANAIARHMLSLLPPGRKPKEGGYAYYTVLALSALLADDAMAVIQMVRDWSPSRTQRIDLLELIGRERGIKRNAGETLEAYRARVVNAADFWRLGGTVAGVRKALGTAGYGVKIIEHYATEKARWAEFSIELYPLRTDFTTDTWDDLQGFWDDGSVWDWGLGRTEVERVRDIIRETKAAHSKVRSVVYQHGGPIDYWDDGSVWDDESAWHGLDPIRVI